MINYKKFKMLDYYGSITKNEDEIILELINYYENKDYNKDLIKNIINDLITTNQISREYSVSGWMVFFKKICIDKINDEIRKKVIIDILYDMINDIDVCNEIYDNI